jgi:hypothetical protein
MLPDARGRQVGLVAFSLVYQRPQDLAVLRIQAHQPHLSQGRSDQHAIRDDGRGMQVAILRPPGLVGEGLRLGGFQRLVRGRTRFPKQSAGLGVMRVDPPGGADEEDLASGVTRSRAPIVAFDRNPIDSFFLMFGDPFLCSGFRVDRDQAVVGGNAPDVRIPALAASDRTKRGGFAGNSGLAAGAVVGDVDGAFRHDGTGRPAGVDGDAQILALAALAAVQSLAAARVAILGLEHLPRLAEIIHQGQPRGPAASIVGGIVGPVRRRLLAGSSAA